MSKPILDACCGSRMFWFDKNNPSVTFADIRAEEHTLCDGRKLSIAPDIEMDFTNMPFANNSYKLVIFDPPHLKSLGESSWMAKKYGVLPKAWQPMIRAGVSECMRVLDDYGVLIFKWNEDQIKIGEIVSAIGITPLVGHKSGRHSKTVWMTFMKMPKVEGGSDATIN